MINTLMRLEGLIDPLRSADQIRLLAFRSFVCDCTVSPLHPKVMERAADLQASNQLQTAAAIDLAAAVHWSCEALLTNHRAVQLSHAPIKVLRVEPVGSDSPATVRPP